MELDVKQTATEIQNGNQEAFKAFYEAYFAKIYSFLLTILHSPEDAEDVTSIAFIYVWDNRGKLRNPEQLVSWLYQIAKHRAFDFRRKRLSQSLTSLDGLEEVIPDNAVSAEDIVDQYLTGRFTEGLLSVLSDHERSIIHLRFAEDLDFQEISNRLNVNSVAVRVRMHRIIKKLRKELDKDEDASIQSNFWKKTIL